MVNAYLLDQGTVDHYQLEDASGNYGLDTAVNVFARNAFDPNAFVTTSAFVVVIPRNPTRGLVMRGRR